MQCHYWTDEHKLLKEKYENHPDALQTKIELKRSQDECEKYQTFFDLGEREVLMEEIRDLRSHLQSYVDPSSSTLAQKRSSSPLLTKPSCDPCLASPPLSTVPESFLESMEDKLEQERAHWTEAESKWISLAEELRIELESSRCLAEKLKRGLDSVKKHADMIVYARVLDQQADLEVKHMELLARYRRIKEGIDDVKKAAQKAGVRGAESKFINALAAEISVLKLEREKERRYLRDENKGLQAQLQDTAEAVQAAGELLVRLKEAEEAAAGAQRRVVEAKQETDKAYKQIDRLKRKHEKGSATFNLEESRYPQEESLRPANPDSSKFDMGDQQWKEEFEPFFEGGDDELSKLAETSSWFAGYDRCNI